MTTATIESVVMEESNPEVQTEMATLRFHESPYGFYGTAYFKDTDGNCYEMDLFVPGNRNLFDGIKKDSGKSFVVTFTTKVKSPVHTHRIVLDIKRG